VSESYNITYNIDNLILREHDEKCVFYIEIFDFVSHRISKTEKLLRCLRVLNWKMKCLFSQWSLEETIEI